MAYFKDKKFEGIEYSMAHLEPFSFSIAHENFQYRVRVEFSHHCFTEEALDWHRPDRRYDYNNDPRSFCKIRYGFSTRLPNIVRGLTGKTVYVGQYGNYFVMRNTDLLGNGPPYLVFMDTTRLRNRKLGDVKLYVQSAYSKANMVAVGQPINFDLLIASTFSSVPVTPGKKVTIKRE